MKCIFIYNPVSGKANINKNLKRVERSLKKTYDVVDMYATKSSNDLEEITKASCEDYDAIIFSGGDGTFNEVARGVSSCTRRPPLGYIPSGTTNDIARNLKIPRNIRGALKVINNQTTIKHDVGKINDKYFIYVAALGVCTGTTYTTKQQEKRIFGRLAYVKNGIDEFLNKPLTHLKVTSGNHVIEREVPLILVLNSISVGGMPFNRYGHLNDGLFDLIIVNNDRSNGRLNIIKVFLSSIFFGKRMPRTSLALHSDHFKIDIIENQKWCIDGEEGPLGSVEISNLHNHLTIFAPKRKARRQKNKE